MGKTELHHRLQRLGLKSTMLTLVIMTHEESTAFAKDSSDIGCFPSLQMPIRLRDKIPVQKANASIPKLMYKEVKEYIQELLVKRWVVKSPYTTPIVCVKKKRWVITPLYQLPTAQQKDCAG